MMPAMPLRAVVRVMRALGQRATAALRHEPIQRRKAALAKLIRRAKAGLVLKEHIDEPGDVVFCHACKLGLEGIVSKRLGSPYRSGRSRHWIKSKNPAAPAVKREAEEDWGKKKWR
jgi:bifunctional non-homologous end joining protein LigD